MPWSGVRGGDRRAAVSRRWRSSACVSNFDTLTRTRTRARLRGPPIWRPTRLRNLPDQRKISGLPIRSLTRAVRSATSSVRAAHSRFSASRRAAVRSRGSSWSRKMYLSRSRVMPTLSARTAVSMTLIRNVLRCRLRSPICTPRESRTMTSVSPRGSSIMPLEEERYPRPATLRGSGRASWMNPSRDHGASRLSSVSASASGDLNATR